MDEIDIEIDVDETSIDGQFQGTDSQKTFNVLVHGLEKYEDLDAFLTQGDARNDLEFGYDPFQADRNLPDDPHIMESTLDSILGVNEEEEVVGEGVINNEDELSHGLYKSDIQGSVEIENKDVKKYNTRKRRKPYNDDMFVYDSPSSKINFMSSNKGEKTKKRQELSLAKARGKQKIKLLGDGCESDYVENEVKHKDMSGNEKTEHNQSFDDRRLTRRQSQLTGIKPSNIRGASEKDSRMETEEDESSRGGSSEDEMSSDVGSNVSQEKAKNVKGAKTIKYENKIKATKRSPENESIESNDEQECEDEGDDGDAGDVEDEDGNYAEENENIKQASPSEEKNVNKRTVKRTKRNDSDESYEFEYGADINKADLSDHKTNEASGRGVNLNTKVPLPGSNLWEKVSGTIGAGATHSQSDTGSLKSRSIPGKVERPSESALKDKKVGAPERKINESTSGRKVDHEKEESKDGSSETKIKTISLDMFLQNSMRKAGKTCRGPGCETPVSPSQKSIYCGQNCINKYSQYVLQVLAKERARMGHTSGNYGNERVLVLERQTGKILTGPAAPTEATLAAWLTRHQSFEVMLSSQSMADERKEKKFIEKKPLPAHLRDNPSLTKDIRMMTAKILNQKKESVDIGKATTSVPVAQPSPSTNTSTQLKRPDPIRISVRNALREALTSRTNGCDDVMVSTNEIKSLAMDIEDELCKVCEGVTAKYKYKVKAIVTQIKDLNNKGFFRRLLFGELQPNLLVRMTNEKITSKELASWNEDSNTLEILGTETTFQPSYSNVSKSPPYQPIFDIVSSATSETTSQHGTHFFDMNCKICTGKVPEPSYNPPPKSDANSFGYYSKSMTQASSVPVASNVSQNNPKVPVKNPLLPTPLMPPQDLFSSSMPVENTSNECDDVLWTGTIYAKEITSVRINTYLISGSLSSVQEDLPETVHMTGRTSPENVFSLLARLRSGGSSKDVAMVYFLPSNPSEGSFYQSLFAFLSSRNRCGVVMPPGVKREIGRIKEFYLMALPAVTPPPSALMPFDGAGLPTTRGDLILGIFIKHVAKMPLVPSAGSKLTNPGKCLLDLGKCSTKIEVQESSSSGTVNDEVESDVDEKVIYSTGKLDHPKNSVVSLKPSAKPVIEDGPYDPFESPATTTTAACTNAASTVTSHTQVTARNATNAESAPSTKQSHSRLNVVTPSNVSILASENIAATMLTTLSAVTNSTSLMEQQKMLQELTQKINEQKFILQQQEQSIKKTIYDPSLCSSVPSPLPTPKKSTQSSVSFSTSKTSHVGNFQPSTSNSASTVSTSSKASGSAIVSNSKAVTTLATKQSGEPKKNEPKEMAITVNAKAQVSKHDKNPAPLPSISGSILTSLPASINQLLSGENLKNLKNIMASVATNKQQTIQNESVQNSSSVPEIKSPSLVNADLKAVEKREEEKRSTREKDSKEDKDYSKDGDLNTNVHGDIDYRFDSKKCQTANTAKENKSHTPEAPGHIVSQALSDQKLEASTKPPLRKPLLATPPQSPCAFVAQSKPGGNVQDDINTGCIIVEHSTCQDGSTSERDIAVWKPLLPCKSASRDRSRRDESASLRRREDNKERSRSRERKRKRSPDDEHRKSERSHFSDNGTKLINDEDNSKDEKAVIIINDNDEEEGNLTEGSKESQEKKTCESSPDKPARKNRSRDRSRESSRSHHSKRHRRSRSRNRKERVSRRSRSRSPVKRQTSSKINPFSLPHSLPSLFPSLLQIVSSINQPRKNDAECGTSGSRTGSIPSLLDMLDPSILPEKYKRADETGLLGSYKNDEMSLHDNVEMKTCKRGLLGDFPNQLAHENKTIDNMPPMGKDLENMKNAGPNRLDGRGQQDDSFNNNSSGNGYRVQEAWHLPDSRVGFDRMAGGSNHFSQEGRMHPKERTLLPTPNSNDHSNSFPSQGWNYSREDMYSKDNMDNSNFCPDNFYGSSTSGLHPQMPQPLPEMRHPRTNDSRPYNRFPQGQMNSQRGYFSKGQRVQRAPFSSPRFSKH